MALYPKLTDQGSKVLMTWTPDLSGQGYRFYVDGAAVSRTFKPSQKSTTFNKPDASSHKYGVQKMDVVDALEEVAFPTAPVPQPPTGSLPLQPPSGYSSPLIITQGGTYKGIAHESRSTDPAIWIQTSEPVVIEDSWVKNMSGGRLIRNDWGMNVHVTIRRVRGYGGAHRFIELEGHRHLTIENCTFENTGGIRTNVDQSGSVLVVRFNRHNNVQHTPEGFGNFIQLNGTRNGTIVVEWNEVVNEHGKSSPEDLISVIAVRNAKIRHNGLKHNSTLDNLPGTNGTVTVENGQGGGGSVPPCEDVEVHDNFMVDVATGLYFERGSIRCIGHHNRLVQDGYLPPPNEGTRIGSGAGGMTLMSGCVDCHFHDNVSGYIDRYGNRNDYNDLSGAGAPHSAAQELALNTTLPNPITYQTEVDEWARWQQKVKAANVKIGA